MTISISGGNRIGVIGDSITAGNGVGVAWCSNTGCLFDQINTNWAAGTPATVPGKVNSSTSKQNSTKAKNNSVTPTRKSISTFTTGVSGDTSAQILARITDITSLTPAPTHVIVECITNDFVQGLSQVTFHSNCVSIWAAIRAAFPGVKLFHIGIFSYYESYPDVTYGATIADWNSQLATLCTANTVEYIDVRASQQTYESINNTPPPGVIQGILTVDGVHPNANPGQINYSTSAYSHFSVQP